MHMSCNIVLRGSDLATPLWQERLRAELRKAQQETGGGGGGDGSCAEQRTPDGAAAASSDQVTVAMLSGRKRLAA
jgi:hypothetical protein